MEYILTLPDEAATLALGRRLGELLAPPGMPRLLLLTGPLGAGKTCLIRGLVTSLPGAERAEVASPTFSLCNLYPTTPPVAHVDLYRVGLVSSPRADAGASIPLNDEVLDLVEDEKTLVCIEWAEFYPSGCLPEAHVEVEWLDAKTGRMVRIAAHGIELPSPI